MLAAVSRPTSDCAILHSQSASYLCPQAPPTALLLEIDTVGVLELFTELGVHRFGLGAAQQRSEGDEYRQEFCQVLGEHMAGPFPSDAQLRQLCQCPPEQENKDEWISMIGHRDAPVPPHELSAVCCPQCRTSTTRPT